MRYFFSPLHYYHPFTHSLSHILPFLDQIGPWGYLILFLISFAEALPVIGLFIPGVSALLFFGFVSSQGYVDVPNLILVAVLGAVAGDFVAYAVGFHGEKLFHQGNRFFKLSHLEIGKTFFKKYGDKSVFIGRFIGPLRPIVPFVAGLVKMPFASFSIWNILSAIIWSAGYIILGFIFGYRIGLIEHWFSRLSLIAFALVVFFVVAYIVRLKTKKEMEVE